MQSALTILAGMCLVATIFIYIKFIYLVKQRKQRYYDEFTKRGYKVLSLPLSPFGFTFVEKFEEENNKGIALESAQKLYLNYDIVLGNVFDKVDILFCTIDFIRQMQKKEVNYLYKKLSYLSRTMDILVGKGLLLTDGPQWKKKRLHMNSMFSFDLIKQSSVRVAQLCDRAIKLTQQKQISKATSQNIFQYCLVQSTIKFSVYVMVEVFMGGTIEEIDCAAEKLEYYIKHTVEKGMNYLNQPQSLIFRKLPLKYSLHPETKNLRQNLNEFHEWGSQFVSKRIAEAKQKQDQGLTNQPKNIIEAMAMANIKSSKESPYSSERDIFEEFITFFVGGTDSSARYLEIALYQIFLHPEVEEKVRKQIDQFMKDDDYSYQNLRNLKYIEALQKQITRMYGPINLCVERQIVEDHYLQEIPLKKGDVTRYIADTIHYSEKNYKDPFTLNPDRWLCQNEEQKAKMILLGFYEGPRACIGKQLALLINKIGIVKFMKHYQKIELPFKKVPLSFGMVLSPHIFESKLYTFQ